jgi:hypothetical protein
MTLVSREVEQSNAKHFRVVPLDEKGLEVILSDGLSIKAAFFDDSENIRILRVPQTVTGNDKLGDLAESLNRLYPKIKFIVIPDNDETKKWAMFRLEEVKEVKRPFFGNFKIKFDNKKKEEAKC